MEDENLIELTKIIKTLKDDLICPICLDILQDVTEFYCGHRLCSDCYLKSKSSKLVCPVCKTVMNRRSSLYKDDYLNNLGKLVASLCLMLEEVQHCSIEEFLLKATKQTSASKIEPPCKEKLITSEGTHKDDFDKLLLEKISQKTLLVKKEQQKRVYANKRKEKRNKDFKLLEFQCFKNKESVKQWLNDTRNMFDRLTQTQNMVRDDGEIDAYILPENLPSVSQIQTLVNFEKPNRIIKKIRSRSVELEIRKTHKNKNSNSFSQVLDNYNIEDIHSEEEKVVEKAEKKVLLNLIEDDLLDKLETELENPVKANRSRKKSESNSIISPNTTANNSGWDRVTEMKKSLRKNPKEPKRLYIVLKSSQSSNKTRKEIDIRRKNGNEGMDAEIIVEKPNAEVENMTKIQKLGPRKRVQATVNKVSEEDDIKIVEIEPNFVEQVTSNMSLIKNTTSNKNNSFQVNQENACGGIDVDPFRIATQELPGSKNNSFDENQGNDKSDDPEFGKPTQKLNPNLSDNSETEDDVISQTDILILLDKNIQKCIGVIDNKSYKGIKRKLKFMQRLIETLKKITPSEVVMETNEVIKAHVFTQTGLDVVDTSVQTVIVEKCHISAQTDIELIDRGVQTKLTENSYSQNNLFSNENKNSSQKNFTNSITQGTKKALESFLSESDISLTNTLKEIQNKMSSGESNAQTAPNLKTQNEIFAATLDNVNFETQELARQIADEKNSIHKSTIVNDSKSKENSQKLSKNDEQFKMKTQNELFTATFDNVNFETQELARQFADGKNSSQKSKSKGDLRKSNLSPQRSSLANKDSQLECTIPSDGGKKVNRKLLFITKEMSHKRNRISSDSDSDVEIVSRRKKNRFINIDLSVEFESESKQLDLKKSQQLTSSSNVDYEDCLNEILRKYDDENKINYDEVNSVDSKEIEKNKSLKNISKEVNRNVKNLSKAKESRTLTNNSFKNRSKQADDNGYENSGRVSSGKPFERNQSQFSDVIGETESLEPLPKKTRTAKFNKAFNHGKLSSTIEKSISKSSQNNFNQCDELNDSFDEAELEKIDLPGKGNSTKDSSPLKINVISNIVVKNDVNTQRNDLNNEDDLFSDEDVVETTPQKDKNGSGDWMPEPNATDLLKRLDIAEPPLSGNNNFDLSLALPPPPGFQDIVEEPENDMETVSSLDPVTVIDQAPSALRVELSSITPDNLSQFFKKESPTNSIKPSPNRTNNERCYQTPHRITKSSTNKFSHSTPSSQTGHNTETLGLSPIQKDNNIFEVLKTSHSDALTSCPKQNTSKQSIMTSTPKQKSIWNYVKLSQLKENEFFLPISAKTKPCIACTRLSNSQIMSISQLTNKKLANYSNVFTSKVTHMIVAVNDQNRLKDYTVKFMNAVAEGIWVLRFEWVMECLNNNCIVPEEPFEVLDDSGYPGPRTARLTKKENPLFENFKFHCPDQFISTTRQNIEDIIRSLGGIIISKPEYLREPDGRIGLIITEARGTQDFEVYEKWLETFKIATVDIEWLSKSIGRYKILSIRPYIWCSDDNLGIYGYPDYLIENVPFTNSEQI